MKRMLLCLALVLAISVSGCVSGEDGKSDKIGVVVSIPPYQEWVSSIGGDKVDVTILIPEGQSPHTYEPTPSQMIKVSEADIWVRNGVGLEFWADKIIDSNPSIGIVDVSSGVDLIAVDDDFDAHIWLSIDVAKRGVQQIYQALRDADPENGEYYQANMASYIAQLDGVDDYILEKLGSDSGKRFIVMHPSWGYFSRDYGLMQIPIEEGGKEPGPGDISRIIDLARQYGIKVIFIEPQFSKNDAEVIANEIDGTVLIINPLSASYVENCMAVANALVEGLA